MINQILQDSLYIEQTQYYFCKFPKVEIEEFVRKNPDKLDRICWYCISRYQKLSEEFIREFQDKVYWYWIFRKQILSEEFRKEFQHKLIKDKCKR